MKRKALIIPGVVAALSAGGLGLKTPSNEGNWQLQYQHLPIVNVVDDNIHIGDYRDFRYHEDGSIAQDNYRNVDFQLSELETVWYIISHFGDNGLAHVFLSFEFSDQQYLVVSIEARLEDDDVYDPIKGLFRNYEQTIVLGSERDIIGLRTHIRQEKVHLYELNISPLTAKSLLLNYLSKADRFVSTPEFYNTLVDNCMTGLLQETQTHRYPWNWLDYRILLPGHSDDLAYELGVLDRQISLEELRRQSLVDPSESEIADTDFSTAIRQ